MDVRWQDAPGRALEILRTGGPRALLFRALGETVYRRLLLIERRLAEPEPGRFCRLDNVETRRIEPADFEAHQALMPEVSRESFDSRLERGHVGVGVWHEGRMVNAGWAGIGRCRVGYVGLWIDLPPRVAYLYDTLTAPEYRGMRLTSARWKTMELLLREAGVAVELGAVSPENTSVLRSSERAGFRIVGRIGWWRITGRKRPFLEYEGVAPGIRLVDE